MPEDDDESMRGTDQVVALSRREYVALPVEADVCGGASTGVGMVTVRLWTSSCG